MAKYVLGIDIGTTAVKAVLVSSEGLILAEANRGHDLLSPLPNWAEEKAEIWWENTRLALADLTARYPREMGQLSGIGCSGMVPALVLLDEAGQPVRNTIQQNDARAIPQIEKISWELDQERLYARTGGRTNQQHIIPRLLWVKENEPEVWARVRTVMGSYDYIVYQLTGVKSLEMNWAIESGAFDIRTRQWLTGDLERFGLSPGLLPPVNPSIQVVGHTLPGLEVIPPGIPVIAGSADHVASTLAASIIDPGDLLIKFGGAGDVLYCVDAIKTSPRLFFDYHIVPERYLINGCMAASGSLVKWYVKDILGDLDPAALSRLDEAAAQVPPASEGLIILPYFLGEKTPLFDPAARGVMFGLTLSHTRSHIFRAVLEAVIYGFRHHVEVLAEMGLRPARIMATNGGAKSRIWCQIAADVLGQTICSYPSHPGSALGVAFLTGMGVGVFQEWEQINLFLADRQIFEPQPPATAVYDRAYNIYRQLYTQLQPSFRQELLLYR